jgi:hypothetical protein
MMREIYWSDGSNVDVSTILNNSGVIRKLYCETSKGDAAPDGWSPKLLIGQVKMASTGNFQFQETTLQLIANALSQTLSCQRSLMSEIRGQCRLWVFVFCGTALLIVCCSEGIV